MKIFHRRRQAATFAVGLLLAFGTAVVGGISASAETAGPQLSVSDPQSLLSAVAPSALGSDAPTTSITVDATPFATQATRSTAPSTYSPVSSGARVSVTTTPSDSKAEAVSMVLDGTTSAQFVNHSGLSSFNTSDAGVKRYVSESSNGASVITAYQSPRSSYVSTTTFDLPASFHAQAAQGGAYYLTDGNTIRGAVLAPWARDASGKALTTSYSWNGLVLSQTVTVPPDAVFPIIADPAWYYTWTAVIKVGSPATLHTAMHNCFNCVFPVPGAPAAFPSPGQLLPLTLSIGPFGYNFHCIFDMESFMSPNQLYPNGEFGFAFDAASGHIDGPGSSISFDFYTDNESDSSIKMRFTVFGNVMNDNPGGLPQAIYLAGAKGMWGSFVSKVVGAVGGPSDPQAQTGYWNWIN